MNDRSTTDLLQEACDDLDRLLDDLGVTETRNGASAAGLHVLDDYLADVDIQPVVRVRAVMESRPPGNQAVLYAITDAHSVVREVERNLRYAVTGHADTPRGGSDANTRRCLKIIPRLGASADDEDRWRAARMLRKAALQIERLPSIDQAVEWKPLRRGDGGLPPRCLHCSCYSLRYAPSSGMVRCLTPGCADDDGKPPQGRLDISQIDGTPCLVWKDGRVQYAPG